MDGQGQIKGYFDGLLGSSVPAPSKDHIKRLAKGLSVLPLAISLGDPAGIGGEVTAKALLKRPALLKRAWLFGDPQSLPAGSRAKLARCRWTLLRAPVSGRAGKASAAGGANRLPLRGGYRRSPAWTARRPPW